MIKLNKKYYNKKYLIELEAEFKEDSNYIILEESIMNLKLANYILENQINENEI